MSEERKEMIFMGVFIALFAVAGGWYIFDFIPDRDAKLFAIHECYVEAGCENGEYDAQCWEECTETAKNQWENHEKGVATK